MYTFGNSAPGQAFGQPAFSATPGAAGQQARPGQAQAQQSPYAYSTPYGQGGFQPYAQQGFPAPPAGQQPSQAQQRAASNIAMSHSAGRQPAGRDLREAYGAEAWDAFRQQEVDARARAMPATRDSDAAFQKMLSARGVPQRDIAAERAALMSRAAPEPDPRRVQAEAEMWDAANYLRGLSEEQSRQLMNSPSAQGMIGEVSDFLNTRKLPGPPPPTAPAAFGQQFGFQPQQGQQFGFQPQQGQQFGFQPGMGPLGGTRQDWMNWGQQGAQQNWAPNYGNAIQGRPDPFQVQVNSPFGGSRQSAAQGRDAFIQSIFNEQNRQFTGTLPGNVDLGRQFARPNYDFQHLWGGAQQMLQGGWQNPFAGALRPLGQ